MLARRCDGGSRVGNGGRRGKSEEQSPGKHEIGGGIVGE